MYLADIGGSLLFIVGIVVMLLVFSFLRQSIRGGSTRGGRGNQPEVVQSLLLDVRLNQALVETFHLREKPRKFEKANWEMNKDKIDFLEGTFAKKCKDCGHEHKDIVERCEKCGSANLREPVQLRSILSYVFETVGEFNDQIKAAKKAKSTSYLNIDAGKLKEPLAMCRQGLEDWMMDTIGKKEIPLKYPTLMDLFLGQR